MAYPPITNGGGLVVIPPTPVSGPIVYSGQAIVPFSWATEAIYTVAGQVNILLTSRVAASVSPINNDVYAQDWFPPVIQNIVAGISFDIVLRPGVGSFNGNVPVSWLWQ